MNRRSSRALAEKPKRSKNGAAASVECGGGTAKGNSRQARYFRSEKWIHVCLRSQKAVGRLGFLNSNNFLIIQKILLASRKRCGVTVGAYANAGNHLHFKVKASSRSDFQDFLRIMTCLIARRVTGARKGQAFGRFWDGLCYSRVLQSRKDEASLGPYFSGLSRLAKKGVRTQRILLGLFHEWRFMRKGKEWDWAQLSLGPPLLLDA